MSSEITWESKYQNVAVVQEVGNQRIDLAMATLLEADDALFAIGRRAVEQGRLRASSINRLLDGSQ